MKPNSGGAVPPSEGSLGNGKSAVLDKHLVNGLVWTAIAKWSGQLFSWATLLIAAHLLVPADYGLIGMAVVYLGFAQILSEFGFGTAVVTFRGLGKTDIEQVNALAAAAGAAGFLISCAMAWPLSIFFRAPQLRAVIVVMSTTFIFAGIQTVPCALLQKDFLFKRVSVIQTLASIIQAASVLIFAWIGWGYWALVLGSVLGGCVAACYFVAARPCKFGWPRMSRIGAITKFSWQVLVARLAWTFYSDADFLVAGRTLGVNVLGSYTMAWNLATIPVEKVTTLVGQVTPSLYSVAHSDKSALQGYLRKLTESVALITFPACVGLAMVAPAAIPLLLGDRWLAAVRPLQILALFAAFRSVGALLGSLLITALRATRFAMWINIFGAVLMPCAFYFASRWGSVGIAYAWVAAYPFILVPVWARTLKEIELPKREYFRAISPAISGSIAIMAAVGLLEWMWGGGRPGYIRLSVEVLVGTVAYIATLLAFHANRVRIIVQFFRRVRGLAPPEAMADGSVESHFSEMPKARFGDE